MYNHRSETEFNLLSVDLGLNVLTYNNLDTMQKILEITNFSKLELLQ